MEGEGLNNMKRLKKLLAIGIIVTPVPGLFIAMYIISGWLVVLQVLGFTVLLGLLALAMVWAKITLSDG